MIIKIQYSFSNNETLYMHKISTQKLSNSQLGNLKFGIIKTKNMKSSSSSKNPQNIYKKGDKKSEKLGYISLRQCVRMLISSSPELFKIDNFVVPNNPMVANNPNATTYFDNAKGKISKDQGRENHSSQNNTLNNGEYKRQFDQKEQLSITSSGTATATVPNDSNKIIDYSVYNRDFLELGNPLTGHGSMKRLLSTKKLLKLKQHHQKSISNSQEILKEVNHDSLIVGQFSKSSNFLFKNDNEDDDDDDEDEQFYHKSNDNSNTMEEKVSSVFQNDKYSLIVKLRFIEYTRDLNYKYDFNLMSSETLLKLESNNQNQTKRELLPPISKIHLNSKSQQNIDKLKAPKASRTLSLPVFNTDTFDPFRQHANRRKPKMHHQGLSFNNSVAPVATRTASMIAAPLADTYPNSSSPSFQTDEQDKQQVVNSTTASSQLLANNLQLREIGNRNKDLVKTLPSQQGKDEMPPQSPMCVNCRATKSIRWAWFCGYTNPTLSETEKSMEGLFCKECHDYYKRYDKIRPPKRKRKQSVSFSSGVVTEGTIVDHSNDGSKAALKNAKATKSVSIAETLALNRTNIDKKRNRKKVKVATSDNHYDLTQIGNLPSFTTSMNSIINDPDFQTYGDPVFQNYNNGINAQLTALEANDATRNGWINDLFKENANGFSVDDRGINSETSEFNNFANPNNIDINEEEIENALLLNSILSNMKTLDNKNTNEVDTDKDSRERAKPKNNDKKSNDEELLLMCSSASSSLPSSPGFLEKK